MRPSFGGDMDLFKQYKLHMKKKENTAGRSRGPASPAPPLVSAASSNFSTPARPATEAASSAHQTPGRTVTPAHTTAGEGHMLSPNHSFSTPATTPSRRPSISTPVAGSNSAVPRRARLTRDEINDKWREIFSTMERWTKDEHAPDLTTLDRISCSYTAAAVAQEAYDAALAKYRLSAPAHAAAAAEHARLVQIALAQKANGVKKGERRLILTALPPAPVEPVAPPLTPYSPSCASVDREWRATLAADPSQLRGDALDHRSLESRLMSFLHREDHPLTLLKESFVGNFLEAYSALKNPALKGCTTSQASDVLIGNALPTLLYFLDLLTKLLSRLFPELEADRNPNTSESIRQSAMESIFPSIFPTLFALYKRKYFFRDAELASKMSILSSTGPGGCNLTLEDMGVSKWFRLDEAVVHEERRKTREKKRARERERRRADGETEAEAVEREAAEDRAREAAEAQRKSGAPEGSAPSTPAVHPITDSVTSEPGFASLAPPSMYKGDPTLLTALAPPDDATFTSPTRSTTLATNMAHSITRLTHEPSSSHGEGGTTPVMPGSVPSAAMSVPIGRQRSSVGGGRDASPISGLSGIRMPTTHLSPVTGFEAGSLGRSPRAEKIQDVLSRSPSRRIPGQALPLPSPSSLSKSHSRSLAVGGAENSPARSRSVTKGFTHHQVAQAEAALNGVGIHRTTTTSHHSTELLAATSALTLANSDVLANSSATPVSVAAPSVPSPTGDAKKQVGFFSSGFGSGDVAGQLARTTPAPEADDPLAALAPTPTPPPSNTSSLSLALRQMRQNGSARATPSAAAAPTGTAPAGRALGFHAQTAVVKSTYLLSSDDDDDEDRNGSEALSDDDSPRMAGMQTPVLGSSLPMLQGLPSSMLTHTPGTGSELLRRERDQKRAKGGGRRSSAVPVAANRPSDAAGIAAGSVAPVGDARPASPHHLRPMQPFVLNSTPSNLTTASAAAASIGAESGDDGAHSDVEEEEEETFPYQEAVVLLRRLSSERTPRDKLQCLIAVSQEVCWCVDRFYARVGFRPRPEELCINADDLLSLVSFILIKSQLPNVISEAAFIDDFISRAMKLHMPGYFLATLQAAIELCSKLDKQRFITREMEEQERREAAARSEQEEGQAKEERQRRPSYLDGANQLHAANGANGAGGHARTTPLPANSQRGSPSSRTTAGSVTPTAQQTPPNAVHRSSSRAIPLPPPAFPPSAASYGVGSVGTGSHRTSTSFPSSPDVRLEGLRVLEPTAAAANSWTQPFELKMEHFSNPDTHPQPTRANAPIRKLAQAAMGLTRGL